MSQTYTITFIIYVRHYQWCFCYANDTGFIPVSNVIWPLLTREKPGEEEWVSLDRQKIPFLLNFSQCHLLLGNYYAVIEHTTEVITKDPGNCFCHRFQPCHSYTVLLLIVKVLFLFFIKCLLLLVMPGYQIIKRFYLITLRCQTFHNLLQIVSQR